MRYIDKFMAAFPFEGLTFDDISLVTQYADFLPHDTDVRTNFSRNETECRCALSRGELDIDVMVCKVYLVVIRSGSLALV